MRRESAPAPPPPPPPNPHPTHQPRAHAQRVSLSSGRQTGPWHLGPVHPPSSLIIALRSLPTSPKRKLPRPWSLPTRLSMLYSPLSLASLHHRTLLHAPTADTGLCGAGIWEASRVGPYWSRAPAHLRARREALRRCSEGPRGGTRPPRGQALSSKPALPHRLPNSAPSLGMVFTLPAQAPGPQVLADAPLPERALQLPTSTPWLKPFPLCPCASSLAPCPLLPLCPAQSGLKGVRSHPPCSHLMSALP